LAPQYRANPRDKIQVDVWPAIVCRGQRPQCVEDIARVGTVADEQTDRMAGLSRSDRCQASKSSKALIAVSGLASPPTATVSRPPGRPRSKWDESPAAASGLSTNSPE
jgi:hypothetical protein